MNTPRLLIASDGEKTAVLIDGVIIGQGIERLDFTTEPEPTISVMNLSVKHVKIDKDGSIEKLLFLVE